MNLLHPKRLGLILTLILALATTVSATITIPAGVWFTSGQGNYSFSAPKTLSDLNLTQGFGNTTFYIKIYPNAPTTSWINVFIHSFDEQLLNMTQTPSANTQIINYFQGIDNSVTYYVIKDGVSFGTFTSNASGYGSFYAPYRSGSEVWTFTETAVTTTTVTTTSTLVTYTAPTQTTILNPYNGTYIAPQNTYLKGIMDALNRLFVQNSQDEGICQLVVDNDSWFGSPEINTMQYISEYTNTEFINEGTYNWKVRCYYNKRWSMWSNTMEINHTDYTKNMHFDWTVIK